VLAVRWTRAPWGSAIRIPASSVAVRSPEKDHSVVAGCVRARSSVDSAGIATSSPLDVLVEFRLVNRLAVGFRLIQKLKLKLIYDRQSVGQSVLVSGAHLGPLTNFSFSLKFLSDICVFVIL
jgi:hypothetical protein